MIKIQPNTFSADLLPIENPRGKVMSEEDLWREQVNEMLRGQRRPLNAPNVTAVLLDSEYTRSGSLLNPTGIYFSLYSTINSWQTLQPASAFKLNSVNSINLRVSTYYDIQSGLIPGSPPTADSDYSMYYYTTIGFQPDVNINGVVAPGYLLDYYMLVIQQEFFYDKSEDTLTITSNSKNIELKNTTSTRQTINFGGSAYPDFNSNPEQITEPQYNRLVNEGGNIYINSFFDGGQLGYGLTNNPILSTNNKAHFEYYWGGPDPASTTYIQMKTNVILTYSGLFANYTPVDNA